MSPTGMTGMNSMGQVDDGSFAKQVSTAMAALAEMYKQAHIAAPGGPLASQIQMLMDAVAESEAEYMGASDASAAPGADAAVPMDGDEMVAEGDPAMMGGGEMDPAMMGGGEMDPALEAEAAGPPPTSWEDAGGQLETMLTAANARKRPM